MVVEIDGNSLTIEEIVTVARNHEEVQLSDEAKSNMRASRMVVENALEAGRVVYGVNTGFGELASTTISNKDLATLQLNLIRSHSVGVGNPLPSDVVRTMMLLRANALAKGFSGIRISTVETLLDMLNAGIIPLVPEQGSVGSSGDLAPLAHMVLVLIGEGEAFYNNQSLKGIDALKEAGVKPVKLKAKEGVALINGTQPMTAIGCLLVYDSLQLIRDAIIASSMSVEALRGTRTAYDFRIHDVRPHEGQIHVAEALREILSDSEINRSHADCGKVQDAYSVRCIPQVLGASLDTIRYIRSVLETEINSATDNPLVFDNGDIISGGNFHGQPVALVMDFLGIALCEIANISERRINRLVNPHLSGLPAFLTQNSGLESGMMIAQYTAAALVSENKILAHPASVDSIPTSADQEDHVSMGTIAARKARTIFKNVQHVIAIEYLCAAQGIDLLAPLKPSLAIADALKEIRLEVPKLERDRILHDDIISVVSLMDAGEIVGSIENATISLIEE